MNLPSILLAVPTGLLIVLIVLIVHRMLVSGTRMTSLTLMSRLSTMGLYMVFAGFATVLLGALLSSPAAIANGVFRMLTGAPLVHVFTTSNLLLAFVVVVFGAAASGFFLVRNHADRSRAVRRFLRGRSAPAGGSGRVPAQYPTSRSSARPDDPQD
jgi:hypothetical protein